MSHARPPQNPPSATLNPALAAKPATDLAALTARYAFKYAELQRTAQRLLSHDDPSELSKAGGKHGRDGMSAERKAREGKDDDDDDHDDDELWNIEDETAGLGTGHIHGTSTSTTTPTATSTAALRRKLLGTRRPLPHTQAGQAPPAGSTVPRKRYGPGSGQGGRGGGAANDSSEEEATERKGRPRNLPSHSNTTAKRKRPLQNMQQRSFGREMFPSTSASTSNITTSVSVSAVQGPRYPSDDGNPDNDNDEHDRDLDGDHAIATLIEPPPAPAGSNPDPKTDADEQKPDTDQDDPGGRGGERGTHNANNKKKTAGSGGARYLDVLLAERAAGKKKRKRRKKGQGLE